MCDGDNLAHNVKLVLRNGQRARNVKTSPEKCCAAIRAAGASSRNAAARALPHAPAGRPTA